MKEPTCAKCRGACCEYVHLSFVNEELADNRRWFALRVGTVNMPGHGQVLFRDCPLLRGDGKCATYDDRPEACKAQPVGGPDCLEAIELRRPRYLAELKRG